MPLFSMSKSSQMIENTSEYINAVHEMNPRFMFFRHEYVLCVLYFLSNSPQNAVSTFMANSPMKVEVAGLLAFLPLQAYPSEWNRAKEGGKMHLPSQRGIAQGAVEKDSKPSKHLSLPVEGGTGATESGECTGEGLMLFALRPST